MLDKTALRRQLLTARSAISPTARASWDAAINANVLAHLAQHSVVSLGVYWPMRGEPDLRPAYAELAASGVQLALPTVISKDAPLDFFAWQPGDITAPDACGVQAPVERTPVTLQALLIPCVGFNDLRFRIGYGTGYYDRSLALQPRPYAIGIAYACAAQAFNPDLHDVPMDLVVTEASGAD